MPAANLTKGGRRPDVVFYPSCVVHLLLRFDETLQVDATPSNNAPDASLTSSEANFANALNFGSSSKSLTPAEANFANALNFGPTADGPQPILEPLVFPGDNSAVTNRVPKRATVELPGLRQAGTFNLTFAYADLPIDPRFVKACAVEIHLGVVSAAEHARAMSGGPPALLKTRAAENPVATLLSDFSPNVGPIGVATDETLVLYGLVDNWAADHDGKEEVTITGRDLRGFLLDAQVPMARMAELDLTKPIDEVVREILNTLAPDIDLTLHVCKNAAEWVGGVVPSPATTDGVTRVRLGADGVSTAKNSGAGSGQDKLSYWDIITRYCGLVGAVPYFRGQYLWIRPARRIFDLLDDQSIPTPFAGGGPRTVQVQDPGGAAWQDVLRVRRMVYGLNITKLSYERKYAKAVPIVEVVSLDDTVRGRGKLLIAQWPPKGSREAILKGDTDAAELSGKALKAEKEPKTTASSQGGNTNRIRIPYPGIRDLAQLQEIAHDIYEELGRGEIGGACNTKSLTSFGGDGADPDMLRLKPGDGMEFVVNRQTTGSRPPVAAAQLIQQESLPFGALVDKLTGVLSRLPDGRPDVNLARVLAATARSQIVGQLRWFRVSNVKYGWSEGQIDINFDFQNYIVARHQVGPSEPVAQTAAADQGPTAAQVRIKAQLAANQKALADAAAARKGQLLADRKAQLDKARAARAQAEAQAQAQAAEEQKNAALQHQLDFGPHGRNNNF